MAIGKDIARAEIYDFVKKIDNASTCVVIGDVEVDISVPSHKVAFKVYDAAHIPTGYPGNYFNFCNLEANKEGYVLFHISTDDWWFRNDAVKSNILKIFGKLPTIGLKNVTFAELPEKMAVEFYYENHHTDLTDGDEFYALLKDGEPIAMVAVSENFISNYCEKKFYQVEDGLENIMMYMYNGVGPKMLEEPFVYSSDQEFPILEKTKKSNFNYCCDSDPHVTFKSILLSHYQPEYITYTGSSHKLYFLKI